MVPENYWESVLELETMLGMGNARIASVNCFLFLLNWYKRGSSIFKVKLLKTAILSSRYFSQSELYEKQNMSKFFTLCSGEGDIANSKCLGLIPY